MTATDTRDPSPPTVLIVEDNDAHARLAQKVLELGGYACTRAASAEEALRCIATSPPALVLMDIVLPGMSGLEATRHLKADVATAGIPIIMVTSNRIEFAGEEAKRAGVDAYIAKPFHYADLIEVVGQILARKSPPAKR